MARSPKRVGSRKPKDDVTDGVSGVVVAAYGRRVQVRLDDGEELNCLMRGRALRPVCADRVRVVRSDQGNVVTDIDERDRVLSRPDRRGREEVLAANVDRLVVVTAPEPPPDAFITDRYLASAERMNANAAIVFNKADAWHDALPDWFTVYEVLGYPVFVTSARTGTGIEALAQWCSQGVGILVGLSGVGKSSLMNALVPDLALRTGQLSSASGEGRHTTTASALHDLPDGGALIDSPGVRDYAPAVHDAADIAQGFREIRSRAPDCRFHNCLHLNEPDCAVRDALAAGDIDARRYESYRRLHNLMRQLRRDH